MLPCFSYFPKPQLRRACRVISLSSGRFPVRNVSTREELPARGWSARARVKVGACVRAREEQCNAVGPRVAVAVTAAAAAGAWTCFFTF
ncbi:hypothetical protein BS50DRAFT_573596 [Corynespora cassiicola Philippines]|uniref:Uncharacterized protein n=1 Tax=Corynespora cassiicola Philippines TaxID=1448308 RepID=A0A2T2NP00_CORCC|nr:hypothetical protein BS50DRAFT_573596 [Corynespora cassiicola Philippines]